MRLSRRNFIESVKAAALLPMLSTATGKGKGLDRGNRDASHRILSCNIRVALDDDEKRGVGWSTRKDVCLRIIKDKKPDILCLQEVLRVQAEDFEKAFKNFMLFGFSGPEMDAHPVGYHGIAKNPILFSKGRYTLLAAGTYWLSETPLVAGSKSWGTARARHANWVRLRDRHDGRDFRVVNLHLDHVSNEAKVQQAKMVVEESSQYQPEFPQILAGDFNARYNSAVFESVRAGGWKEAYERVHGEGEAGHTGHEFQGVAYQKAANKGRIDFVWCRGKVAPKTATIIKDQIGGVYPSDHFFMSADVVIG